MQFRPTETDLQNLKSPMGVLLRGSPAETIPRLRKLIEEAKPPKVITVGDVVSKETLAAHIKVHLRIVDNRTLRAPVQSQRFPGRIYRVKNPRGVITIESWNAIRKALKSRSQAVIFVDGEEDLLALPCLLEAQDGSFVAYGQPSEGLVIVRSTSVKKREVANILERMIRENS